MSRPAGEAMEHPPMLSHDGRPPAAKTLATFAPPAPINARQMWANNRFWMETQNLVTKRYGGKRKQHWYALLMLRRSPD